MSRAKTEWRLWRGMPMRKMTDAEGFAMVRVKQAARPTIMPAAEWEHLRRVDYLGRPIE